MNVQRCISRLCLLVIAFAVTSVAIAAPFDAIYVLGDSLSDVGNRLATDGTVTRPLFTPQVPDSPYAYGGGRYSNGPVWVDYLAGELGLPLSPSELGNGNGYAYGGARTGALPGVADNGIPTVVAQASQLVADVGTLSSHSLVVLWGGGNDVRDAGGIAGGGNLAGAVAVITASINNLDSTIRTLAAHGAEHFLVPNLPDLSLTPAAIAGGPAVQFGAHQLSLQFNSGLGQLLSLLGGSLGVQISAFDTFALANDIVQHPGQYGFTNVSAPCALANDGLGCGHPDQYLFWDAIHPGTRFHEILAQTAVPLPPAVWLLGSSLGGLLLVRRRAPDSGRRALSLTKGTALGSARPLTLLVLALCFAGEHAMADSLQSSGRALQHSVNAVGYALTGTAQLVSGAAAVPLGFAGAVGQMSSAASDELMKAANADVSAPLPIADDVITAGPPPSAVMQNDRGDQR